MHKSLVLSAILLAANAAWAESNTENPLETKVDSRVLLEIEHAVPRVVRGPSIGETASVRFANSAPVMILLHTPATKEILSSLEAAGARVDGPVGDIPNYDDGCGCDTVGDRPFGDPGLIETVIDLWLTT